MRRFGRIMACVGTTAFAVVLGLIAGGSTKCTTLYWLTKDGQRLELLEDEEHIFSMMRGGAHLSQTCYPLGFTIEGSGALAGLLTMGWIALFVIVGLILVRMTGKRSTPPEN